MSTDRALNYTLNRLAKNYPQGITCRLFDQPIADAEHGEKKIVFLLPELDAATFWQTPDGDFLQAMVERGFRLTRNAVAVMPVAEFGQSTESSAVVIALGATAPVQSATLSCEWSLETLRTDTVKKKTFWDMVKKNVLDKKLI